ncbi:MAG: alkaline phosphatase family protein [Micropruina sp.]|nr:alkaline phosphatase family protein [Micropruina sp.]
MTAPLVPDYGRGTLADLLPSIAAGMGAGGDNRLDLPPADRWVVLLVDGLGWDQLAGRESIAPALTSLVAQGRAITSGVPSTTVTSLSCLGTGLTPAEHGMAGYAFRYPPIGRILNALTWAPGLNGEDVQPQLTYLERIATSGVAVSSVAPARFRRSGLTAAALRGTHFLGVHDETDVDRRVELITQALDRGPRSLVYAYERALDHTGHGRGVDSEAWRAQLAWTDRLVLRIIAALPGDAALLITGDHGMIDVAPSDQVVMEDEPELMADLAMFGGEGRLRQLYVAPGREAAVARRWTDRFGDDAWVRTRDEAFDEGWFGPHSPRLADRFGDVLVAMAGPHAVMTRTLPNELALIGMHGSLTPAEMRVPLLVTRGSLG